MNGGRAPLELLFLWHHHQPDYRRAADGRSRLPWVRLHATKDYLDMARRLERYPRLRATFNLVPSLVDQIEDAVAGVPDDLFDALARPVAQLQGAARGAVIRRCRMVPPHAGERWPRLRELLDATRDPATVDHGRLAALQGWFLLAWLDPMFLDEPEAVAALAAPRPSERERDGLLRLHARLTAQVLPAYRRLAETGQVELSASPYYHPILPLLVDTRVAQRARPDLAAPFEPFAAPEDARMQVLRARERHARAFGAPPSGMWPSEGSVSPEVAAIAAECGIRWLATDEGVLWRSLPEDARRRPLLYRPWRLRTPHGDVALFFRDRDLSDRIGFVYQRWDPVEAATDFLQRLRRIATEAEGPRPPVVSVILDGENCWEGYADDGAPFLDALYGALDEAEDVRTVTPSQVLDERGDPDELHELHSGSWIDADFHIWIGHPEKNRGWELLARARRSLVQAGATPETHPAAWESLHRAEGSDWFWWYGDDHYTEDKDVFDGLFREHLRAVYERAGLPVPASLRMPIFRPTGDPGAHVRPIGPVHPTIDGRRTGFYEWHAAGRIRLDAGGGAMHREASLTRELHYGFDDEHFYLRLDPGSRRPSHPLGLRLDLIEPLPMRVEIADLAAAEPELHAIRADGTVERLAGGRCRAGEIVEIAVPVASLGLKPGGRLELLVQLLGPDGPVESLPPDDVLRATLPDAQEEARLWSAS